MVISRFFTVTAPAAGLLIENILQYSTEHTKHSGYIKQIIIRATSGGGTTLNLDIRYLPDDSSYSNLVYKYEGTGIELPLFVDSRIDAPFSLKEENVGLELNMWVEPELDAVLDIRVDFEVDRTPGSAA